MEVMRSSQEALLTIVEVRRLAAHTSVNEVRKLGHEIHFHDVSVCCVGGVQRQSEQYGESLKKKQRPPLVTFQIAASFTLTPLPELTS